MAVAVAVVLRQSVEILPVLAHRIRKAVLEEMV
jgi:hypothetical protein